MKDRAVPSLAAEAVEKLLVRANRKGDFFIMEWAQTRVVLTGLFQRNAVFDHADNVGAID